MMDGLQFKDGDTTEGEANFGLASARNKRKNASYDRIRETGYLFGPGVGFASIKDPPQQNMTWTCRRCGVEWKTFKEFLYDGCSPFYPRRVIQ